MSSRNTFLYLPSRNDFEGRRRSFLSPGLLVFWLFRKIWCISQTIVDGGCGRWSGADTRLTPVRWGLVRSSPCMPRSLLPIVWPASTARTGPSSSHDIGVVGVPLSDEFSFVDYQLAGRLHVTLFEADTAPFATFHTRGLFQVRGVTSLRRRINVGIYVRQPFNELGRVGTQCNSLGRRRPVISFLFHLHDFLSSWYISPTAPPLAIVGYFRWFRITEWRWKGVLMSCQFAHIRLFFTSPPTAYTGLNGRL